MDLTVWCPMRSEAKALQSSNLLSTNVSVSASGIGRKKSRSWVASQKLEDIQTLLIVGYGGAVDASLQLGQIFVADEVMAVQKAPNLENGAKLERTPLPAARDFIGNLNLPDIKMGAIYSSLRPVITRSKRRKIQDLGAKVVDMESWWLIQDLPPDLAKRTIVMRVISDTRATDIVKLRKHLKIANAGLGILGAAIQESFKL